ncbi:aminoacyl-histidine dipeptidase [bacterium SCSIO 12741]|nr:aminoacyl-histidine dipeptidase [bacterium SCSIO 12741]
MSSEVRNLEPKALWNNFEDLNAVPRPSKKEERVIQFIVDFGKKLGLETEQDEIGNVLIRKPATPGMESRMGVVLQSHLDMVHQKNNETNFDFLTEGIRSYIDGDWVKAEGTTLGADNGIGVAAAMTVLAATDMPHGPIEALFTIDEETGMTGADNLTPGWLKGDILLNMDTEDEGELCIGCAGGIDTTVSYNYASDAIPADWSTYKLTIKGLFGGHSGCDIHLQRGNSNKMMSRLLLLLNEKTDVRLIQFDGGSLRNAIPREAFVTVAFDAAKLGDLEGVIKEYEAVSKVEFAQTDKGLTLVWEEAQASGQMMNKDDQYKLLRALDGAPNGVYRWSNDFEGLVETSTNTSRVLIENGTFKVDYLTRSSVEHSKDDLAAKIQHVYELIGASVEHAGSYPGWAPNPDSDILKVMRGIHEDFFGEKPIVNAVHAGLECGIISRTQPQLDMISFGPTIKNPHSPDEMVHIGTVERFWRYLQKILNEIPSKN